jgi:hypothetical protein
MGMVPSHTVYLAVHRRETTTERDPEREGRMHSFSFLPQLQHPAFSGCRLRATGQCSKVLITCADIFGEDDEWISIFRMFFLSASALPLPCSAILRSFFFSAAASLSATEKTGPAWSYPVGLPV